MRYFVDACVYRRYNSAVKLTSAHIETRVHTRCMHMHTHAPLNSLPSSGSDVTDSGFSLFSIPRAPSLATK